MPAYGDLFHVSVSQGLDGVLVSVRGELDTYTAPRLRERLDAVIEENGHTALRLELSGMTFVDSSGLAVFVEALKKMRQRGGALSLHSPTPATTKVLEISGLDRIFEIRP